MSPTFPSRLCGVAVGLAVGLGCTSASPPASPPTASTPAVTPAAAPAATEGAPDVSGVVGLRGTLTLDNPSTLVACDGTVPDVGGIEAIAAEIRTSLRGVTGQVYIEARIVPGAEGKRVLRALDVAIAEGPGCGLQADGWQLRATGSEPFWWAELRGGEVRWQRMDDAAPSSVTIGVPITEAKRRAWSGPAADGKVVTLDVRRERCFDAMASAFYPYQATLSVGDWSGTGCARTPPP